MNFIADGVTASELSLAPIRLTLPPDFHLVRFNAGAPDNLHTNPFG